MASMALHVVYEFVVVVVVSLVARNLYLHSKLPRYQGFRDFSMTLNLIDFNVNLKFVL